MYFGLTSYLLNQADNEIPHIFSQIDGYWFTSLVSPFLSFGIADMTSGYLNYYGSNNSWKISFKDLYLIVWKSSFKVFSFLGASLWGFSLTNMAFR